MPDDQAILKEQEKLISGLNPPQLLIFRTQRASNALALAGNLPEATGATAGSDGWAKAVAAGLHARALKQKNKRILAGADG